MHLHEIRDSDAHFIIDPVTMTITNPNALKNKLQQGDHNSEIFTFEMPRYIEGHDMSLCNKKEVHYNNVNYDKNTRTTTVNKSYDDVKNFAVAEDDENIIVFEWLIRGDATEQDGTLNFGFRFACLTDDTVEYQKFIEPFEGIIVGKNIYNKEQVKKTYTDVIERMQAHMENAPVKLSDLENDLFYLKREQIVSITMDDCTVDEANEVIIYEGTHKLNWLTPENFKDVLGYKVSAEGYIVTEKDAPFAECQIIDETNDIAGYFGDLPIQILNGVTLDITSETIAPKDAFTILFYVHFDTFVLYRRDEKKVPIEYCDTSEIETELEQLADEVRTL